MRIVRNVLICAVSMLFVAGGASAQFVNGDFENGSEGWTWSLETNWLIDFPADGGNPGGRATITSPFGDSGGTSSMWQQFDCGSESPETCVITLEYMLENIDATSQSARVRVFLDNDEVHVSDPSDFIEWTTVAIYPLCGPHTVTVYLEVDAGNNGWVASFDNFVATCDPVPTESRTWSTIKTLYR